MMDKATPTSRARKPGTLLAKNLNDLSSFLRKKKMQGMDPSLKAPCESVNQRACRKKKDGPLCISFFPERKELKYLTPHHGEPLLVIGMR